jgi:hypothetical protein
MAENKEAIVLDSTDNVFVGPNEYFKIVIDEFDGESVQAWHIEDSMGNSTMNLARGEGKHIDALVNKDCRTVWHFGSRVAPSIIAEEQAKVEELKAQVEELKAQMGEGEAMMEEESSEDSN